MAYNPQPDTAKLLDAAWGFVQSVPYQVSARWLFYRLLQDGWLSTKADYKRIISILSTARKRFYRSWAPDTLADDTRTVQTVGRGYLTVDEWLDAIGENQVFSYVDRWERQDNYVIVCFEAAAMAGQFDFYLPDFVTRVAFKGDVSIPAKWKIAQAIDKAALRYQNDVVVIYFGDLDPKGLLIPESAMEDIRDWTTDRFQYFRAGLNPGDEVTYDIAENPERPGTYQWEALDDDTAGRVITDALAPYVKPELGKDCETEDDRRIEAFREWWKTNQPDADDLGLEEEND